MVVAEVVVASEAGVVLDNTTMVVDAKVELFMTAVVDRLDDPLDID